MTKRALTSLRCIKCRINVPLCVCEHIRPLTIQTNISLVVHVSELSLTSNTAQFIRHMLPSQAEIYVRGEQKEVFTPDRILERPGQPLFLFPSEDSVELNDEFLKNNPGPHHLIVPDGKWTQAIKVRNREPAFKKLQAVRLPPGILAEYMLRKARHPEWVSTYESVAHALGIIEGTETRDELMTFFRIWVKRTMFNRTGFMKYSD